MTQHNLKKTITISEDDNDEPPCHISTPNVNTSHYNPSYTPRQSTYESSLYPDYTEVSLFDNYIETRSLEEARISLKSFIEHTSKNIMFIFGPSGCGKTMLVRHACKDSEIVIENIAEEMFLNEEDEFVWKDLMEQIEEKLTAELRHDAVYLFKDFPICCNDSGTLELIRTRRFKRKFPALTRSCCNQNKHIFVLNSEIYSSFIILNEGCESPESRVGILPNVSVLKLDSYTKTEMKILINNFVSFLPTFSNFVNNSLKMTEIVEEANGDARKAFHILYLRKMEQYARICFKKTYESCQIDFAADPNTKINTNMDIDKNNNRPTKQYHRTIDDKESDIQKYSIFHMLGKFLYGKRMNINHHKHNPKKLRNNLSRFYTQEELISLDPAFYFDPILLFESSKLELSRFVDLIEANYLSRFGTVQDINKMSRLFSLYDTLPTPTTIKELELVTTSLITWGILIYNRNSEKSPKGMFHIGRSKHLLVQRLINEKKLVLRSYFIHSDANSSFVYHHRIADIIMFAHCLRNSNLQSLSLNLLCKVVFQNKKNARFELEATTRVITDEDDEDEAEEECGRMKKIIQELVNEKIKKENLRKLVMRDSDSEDINDT